MRRWLVRIGATLLLLAAALLAAGQAGALRGTPPADLGVRDGRLKAPSATPNSVSSQAGLWSGHPRAQAAAVAPLPLRGGDGPATLRRLAEVVAALPGARIVEQREDYLRAECETRWLRFVDDLELWFDSTAGVVQVRSASRIGRGDWGVNRARVETLRTALAAP